MPSFFSDSVSTFVPAWQAAVADLLAGFGTLPLWAGLAILVLPGLCALLLRSLPATLAAFVASAFALVAFDTTAISAGSLSPLAFYALAWIAALLAADRGREPVLARIEAKVSHVEMQMIGFLQALDRRAEISEKTAPRDSSQA